MCARAIKSHRCMQRTNFGAQIVSRQKQLNFYFVFIFSPPPHPTFVCVPHVQTHTRVIGISSMCIMQCHCCIVQRCARAESGAHLPSLWGTVPSQQGGMPVLQLRAAARRMWQATVSELRRFPPISGRKGNGEGFKWRAPATTRFHDHGRI